MRESAVVTRSVHAIQQLPNAGTSRRFRLDTIRFALAGGIYLAVCGALVTAASVLGVPGFPPFTRLLLDWYGAYGYSVTWTGVLVGAFWGFVEGFVHLGLFALLYNRLLSIRF